MSCLSDEVLRAQLDNELSEAERRSAGEHLAACAACRQRLETIFRASEAVAQSLGALSPRGSLASEQSAGLDRAVAKFQARLDQEAAAPPKPRSAIVSIFLRHPMPAWGATAIAALVIIMAALAPARSLGQRVLAMLRIEKVAVVPVDFNLSPGPNTQALVRQVISSDITVTLSPGKPQTAANAAQASTMAGFQVRISPTGPNGEGAPRIGVLGEQSYVMTLDQSRLQGILDSLGRNNLQLPASINGQTIAVHIPKMALIRYGACPSQRHQDPGSAEEPAPGANAQSGCTTLIEAPSPIVSVPPDLNVNQLVEVGLEAAGMSPAQASSVSHSIDWKSTLAVPIPTRVSSYVKESVDGVEGDLILSNGARGRPAEYELIWVKNGVIYSIHGYGDSNRALALAGSLGD